MIGWLQVNKQWIAFFTALLFHVSGLIGMCTGYREWFIAHTPLNLCLMAVLLIVTHTRRNAGFWLFALLVYLAGMWVEVVGVNTQQLFGHYTYTPVMGRQWQGVPLLIGVNWFVVVYCCGTTAQLLLNKLPVSTGAQTRPSSRYGGALLMMLSGGLLATLFDWIMEPAAVKLGLWVWPGTQGVPLFNYGCWFLVSVLLLLVFKLLRFQCNNQFALHLLVIETLFFILIRTFL